VFWLGVLASFSTLANAATPVNPTFFDRYDYSGSCVAYMDHGGA
jgi:hypothetical protein